MKKTVRRRKTRETYSTGEINRLIDSLIHPLSKTNKGFVLIDALLHGLVEQNPPQSVKKFMKYSLPELIKQLEKTAASKAEEKSRQEQ